MSGPRPSGLSTPKGCGCYKRPSPALTNFDGALTHTRVEACEVRISARRETLLKGLGFGKENKQQHVWVDNMMGGGGMSGGGSVGVSGSPTSSNPLSHILSGLGGLLGKLHLGGGKLPSALGGSGDPLGLNVPSVDVSGGAPA